ncbi:hypothetical protein ACXYMU_15840 [Pontibacter sp. CAU 1760]
MQSNLKRYPILCLLFVILALSSCSDRFIHSVQQVPPPAGTNHTPTYRDSTITVKAGQHYGRSGLHTFFYGKHYRPVWLAPVKAPVLDIGSIHGGLTPMELGGSRQSISLRLEDSTGTEYVLRSVDKEPASALPESWQRSYLANIVRDATSATHPYAALALPDMAEALGIYYVEPQLVYVPHDDRLGKFKDDVGGMLALLERRPSGNQKDYEPMGRASEVVSTRSAITERLQDNDSHFDARFFLRARLFDMLIGDWSRHEDNWRWAEEKQNQGGKTYMAIPRDRDNAFYKLKDAPVPWLFMLLNLKPHFQTFRSEIDNIEKLNRSGRNLDELILNNLEWSDWQAEIAHVQQSLTDQVIEQSFRAMPENVAAMSAAAIISKLKSRRQHLEEAAQTYYKALAENVAVVGTDKHERFEVEALAEDKVQVRVFKITKEGKVEQQIYARTFRAAETEELYLYGLNGDDQFHFTGGVRTKIKIKVWGGAGEDIYRQADENSPFGKRIDITDTKYRNTYQMSKKASVEIDDDLKAKDFDAEGWLLRYYLN